MDRYCSLVVHLFRGRELGARNALTGNVKWCTKHKILQTCDNINGCNSLYVDGIYSLLSTCHCVIRDTRDENYSEFRSREYVEDEITLLYETYIYVQC